MKVVRHTRRGPLGRAATLIEFALVIPIFLYLMLFSVDMGMLMLTHGAMEDAAFSAARAGAQAGGGGYSTGDGDCQANGQCAAGVAFEVAQDGVANLPLAQGSEWSYDENQFRVVSGAQCRTTGTERFVTVEMPYTVHFLTPGLSSLLGITGKGGHAGDGFSMTATGVARCEVYRTP